MGSSEGVLSGGTGEVAGIVLVVVAGCRELGVEVPGDATAGYPT